MCEHEYEETYKDGRKQILTCVKCGYESIGYFKEVERVS